VAVDDLGQLLQHREKEKEVSYEPEPREGQRRVWRRMTLGAGDSSGATVLDSDSEAPVNRGGRWWVLRHRTDEREVRRYFNADRETGIVELPVMTTVGVRNLAGEMAVRRPAQTGGR
jgi:hypothetical protein